MATIPVYARDRGRWWKSKPSGRGLRSPDGRHEAAIRLVSAFDGRGWIDLIDAKLWIGGVCQHEIFDTRDGARLGEGRGRTESESWSMVKSLLESRGYSVE
jgi:hypothetical protein